MALVKTIDGKDVVFKVETVQLVTDKQMKIFVSTDGSASSVKQYDAPLDYTKAYVSQAYKHLKTLPAFAGAIDC